MTDMNNGKTPLFIVTNKLCTHQKSLGNDQLNQQTSRKNLLKSLKKKKRRITYVPAMIQPSTNKEYSDDYLANRNKKSNGVVVASPNI